MKQLTSDERSKLRARAHDLNPVVIIGNGGLTPGVMAEIERSLKAHDLIKIRVGGADCVARETINADICAATMASPVQHVGKILVIYRESPKEETARPAKLLRKKSAPSPIGRNRKTAANLWVGQKTVSTHPSRRPRTKR